MPTCRISSEPTPREAVPGRDDDEQAVGTAICESKHAISRILHIVMNNDEVVHQLRKIMETLSSITWLEMVEKGAIFLVNSQQELVMIADHGLDEDTRTQCARIPLGQCFCGRAAQTGETQFQSRPGRELFSCLAQAAECGHYNIPLKNPAGAVIGVICLYVKAGHVPHQEEAELMDMVGGIVSAVLQNKNLQLQSRINRIRWQHAQQDVLHKLVMASEFRDNDTGDHIKRMSKYSRVIGKWIELDEDQLDLLERAAPLHDIGKIGIPDEILLKPGRLSDSERKVMQEHTRIGGDILSGSHPLIIASRQIANHHHEKWDGTGYPKGLKGEEIPLFARICAIADVFDALTMKRPYKEPWPVEKAVEWIVSESGSSFDPELVTAFHKGLPDILEIKTVFSSGENNGLEGFRNEFLREERDVPGWDDSYSVGVWQIDRQHQYLIGLINRIKNASMEFNPQLIVETILDMQSYARFHFADEEDLMRRYEYPDLARHARIHAGFIHKAETFLDDLEDIPLATISEVSGFLSEWLINHIVKTDGEYSKYIANHAEDVAAAEGIRDAEELLQMM